jgi:hypothetical protein
MKNVEMKVEGRFLTIKVDLTKDFGPSSSGKTIVAVNGHEEAKAGMNIYRKISHRVRRFRASSI